MTRPRHSCVPPSISRADAGEPTTDDRRLTPLARQQQDDPALLWSTYAPQLYFAVRPRLPKSLVSGLMWFGLNDWEGIQRPSLSSLRLPPLRAASSLD